MSVTIRDYINNAKFVRNNLETETDRIIQDHKQEILDLNREDQLFDKGINSDGSMLEAYSPKTVKIKKSKGEVYNRTTLLDEGPFYAGFDLFNKNGTLSIFSRDSKSIELQDKYGSNIFGLVTDNAKKLNYEIIKPDLDKFIQKYL